MEVHQDFRELLELLNAHRVDFAVVGAYALAFYGVVRTTGDIDILVRPDTENAERIVAALADFGFSSLGYQAQDFTEPDQAIQLGVAPYRVDILTTLTGVSWETVAAGRVPGMYGDVKVFYIGRDQLILNKRATGRKKDDADLEALGE